tara:strand:+ start:8907 stop:9398 length:492 start_codon:yes stop_codon:yes gene_type:complete
MTKKLKTETNIQTDMDTYKRNKTAIDAEVEDGDSGSLTINPDPIDEGNVSESIKVKAYDILKALGVNILNRSPEEKYEILQIVRRAIEALSNKGYTQVVMSEDEDELGGLYSGADSRSVEYGVDSNGEDYQSLVNKLNKKDVNESVNPRMKKKDLINFIKNKK